MHNNGIFVGGNLTVSGGAVRNTAAPDTSTRPRAGIDVLVIAALKEEYDAAKAVAGMSPWREHGAGGQEPYVTATYDPGTGAAHGGARPPDPDGWPGHRPIATALTDEAAADLPGHVRRVRGQSRRHRAGRRDHRRAGVRVGRGQGLPATASSADHQQFPQDARWARAVQDFDPSGLPSHGTATEEEAAVWYLEQLHKDQDPRKHPARERYFPRGTWVPGLERLQSAGLIVAAGRRLGADRRRAGPPSGAACTTTSTGRSGCRSWSSRGRWPAAAPSWPTRGSGTGSRSPSARSWPWRWRRRPSPRSPTSGRSRTGWSPRA